MAADAERPISELPLLSEAERRRLLEEWNATEAEYPGEKCLHELFEEQAERTPDAVAVVLEEQSLTYRELNRRANRVAHHLREMGIGAEFSYLPVCTDEGIDFLVSCLAAIKSGCAFAPFNTTWPTTRILEGVKKLEARLTITNNPDIAETLKANGIDVLLLTFPLLSEEEQIPAGRPAPTVSAETPLYAIFTSR